MKPQDNASSNPSDTFTPPDALAAPPTTGPGSVSYGYLYGFVDSSAQVNIELDKAKTYLIETSNDGGATWQVLPPVAQVPSGASNYAYSLNLAGGVPMRAVEQ